MGNQFLTQSQYKQMIGRAGRSGFCEEGESILMFKDCEKEKVHRYNIIITNKANADVYYYKVFIHHIRYICCYPVHVKVVQVALLVVGHQCCVLLYSL